ncbi:recombinase family protein [Anaerocolumna sp. MB42-C2]|uniref:recombinase family protein n=1 Tax=Anaerocolumna sp. MB42-C2 TaxID=3070997 RepID=UPI0027E12A7E|nr:recombinase family protein [Anaerocolumna sp. MB42-C2]WMJ85456.1 recombinase family protein [Anaerocolumna sp. MB42-C2]
MLKKPEKTLKHVALYLRVSSDRQAKVGDSLREQLETLQDYVTRRDDLVVYDTYIDDGISGQKLSRDEFTRLMDDVKSGEIDIILFTKLDRWFRNLRHYLNVQAMLEEHNVSWAAVSQPFFDTTTAHGRAFVAQSMTWAELEAQNDSERILAVFENKVKNGEVISGTTPFGYKIENKHLVPNEDLKYVVATFNCYKRTGNLIETMKYMREEYGINKTAATYRRSILKNRIYIGEYRGNKNYCNPIIDQETYDLVQHLLSKNIRKNQTHEYMFSGLVKCGDCGAAMAAHQVSGIGHPRLDGTRKRYKRSGYRCKKHFDLKLCDNKKILFESTLEKYLISHLREDIEVYIGEYEATVAPVVNFAEKKKKIEAKIERLKDLYVNELITMDEFKIDRARYLEQLNSLPQFETPKKDLGPIKRLLDSNIEEIYDNFEFNKKKWFWRSILQEVQFYSDRTIKPIFL